VARADYRDLHRRTQDLVRSVASSSFDKTPPEALLAPVIGAPDRYSCTATDVGSPGESLAGLSGPGDVRGRGPE
jgi:hypothetical protein